MFSKHGFSSGFLDATKGVLGVVPDKVDEETRQAEELAKSNEAIQATAQAITDRNAARKSQY